MDTTTLLWGVALIASHFVAGLIGRKLTPAAPDSPATPAVPLPALPALDASKHPLLAKLLASKAARDAEAELLQLAEELIAARQPK